MSDEISLMYFGILLGALAVLTVCLYALKEVSPNPRKPSGSDLAPNAVAPKEYTFGTLLGACTDGPALRSATEKLWSIIDDIDTYSDMVKPTDLKAYKRFYDLTMRKVKERHPVVHSDGYDLFMPSENRVSLETYRDMLDVADSYYAQLAYVEELSQLRHVVLTVRGGVWVLRLEATHDVPASNLRGDSLSDVVQMHKCDMDKERPHEPQ